MYLKLKFSLILFVLPASLHAQAVCTAEVAYQWTKEKAETALKGPVKVVEAQGADETGAKAALAPRVTEAKNSVLEICRKEHENLAACISTKIAASSSALQSASFSVRKAIEEAISTDCRNATGECKESYASEPQCAVQASSSSAAAETKEEKGGKKKK